MSRLLFGLGAQGPLVVDLQQALITKGFDPKGADGLFGRDTEAAIRAFQSGVAARVTGSVSDDDWSAITGRPVPDVESRCLQLTSTFEGHGYELALGNWDGAWLTWGIIGFTLRHGGIQTIVRNIKRDAPECLRQAFGAQCDPFLRIIGSAPAEQEAWARSVTVGARIAEPWRTHFQCFGSLPEVRAAQRALAHTDYFVPALQTASALGLSAELGVSLCFDIQVQNGGVGPVLRAKLLKQLHGEPESVVRETLANAIADRARPRFRDDVRARKLAIAHGHGVVHRRKVVLANWGLADFAAASRARERPRKV